MELRNLHSFQQVAEKNSFTAAAEALGYSQSTISFQIRQLEEELGCRLFERINHNISLTQEGLELLDYAQRMLRLTGEVKEKLHPTGEIEGFVHIVTPDSICEAMMMTNYADFYRHYPKIRLKFSTADTGDMFRMLDRNEADIIHTLDSHVYSPEYIIAREERAKVHFVTAAGSPLAKRRNLSIEDLLDEPFILTEKGMSYRRVLDEVLEKRSLRLTPILEIGRTDIIVATLAKGIGISFLPELVTRQAVQEGQLCYLDVTDPEIDIWKQLIYHRSKWISRSLRAFIDYVKQAEFSNEEAQHG
ncbi:MAG: LysR family transcriptional regulator [Oscillospiraceae bacterium]|nr:LysR family transcriptional regulator [Oscillospiraceae bacterium]